MVAGCGFEHGVDPAGQPDGAVVDPGADAAVTVPAGPCKFPDGSLRLCIEFQDRKYSGSVSDTSPYQLNAIADELGEWTRNNQPAAATYWNTLVRVPESPMLDITDSITFELWVRSLYQYGTMLSNDGQYAIGMDLSGRVTCRIGNTTVTSDPIGQDAWRHIACTKTGERMAIHIDGIATKCQDASSSIPTGGTQGTKITPGFIGFIDDIRIYARKLTALEICSHADKSQCQSSCSDE